jgi:hypothetical protein
VRDVRHHGDDDPAVGQREQRHHPASDELTVADALVREAKAHQIGRGGIERHRAGEAGVVARTHPLDAASWIGTESRNVDRRDRFGAVPAPATERGEQPVVDDVEDRRVLLRLADVLGILFGRRLRGRVVHAERLEDLLSHEREERLPRRACDRRAHRIGGLWAALTEPRIFVVDADRVDR